MNNDLTSLEGASTTVAAILHRDYGPVQVDWKSLIDRDGLRQWYADVRLAGTSIYVEINEPAPVDNPSETGFDEANFPSVMFVVRLTHRFPFPTDILQIYSVLTAHHGITLNPGHDMRNLWIETASVCAPANALNTRKLRDQIKALVELEFKLDATK